MQLTTAVFYNNYRDIQFGATARPAYAQIPVAMVNAGNARTYGAEASVTARVADPLTIGAGVGYLNARYKKGFGIPASNPVLEPIDLSNARMLNSPNWQLNFNADFDQPVSNRFRVVANALASYTSQTIWYFRGASYLPDAVGPSYWLINARVGLRTTNDNYELAVFAKNLFNRGYTTYGASSAASGTVLVWGEPRIVGVEGTLKF